VIASAYGGLTGVACSSPGRCLAVGSYAGAGSSGGDADLLITRGAPGARHFLDDQLPGRGAELACPTANTCLVGARSFQHLNVQHPAVAKIVRIVNGSPRAVLSLPETATWPYAIGCVSSTTCVVTAPSLPGRSPWLFTLTNDRLNGRQPASISADTMSCIPSQGCVTFGSTQAGTTAVTISPTSAVRTAVLSNQNLSFTALSCRSLDNCWALGGSSSINDLIRLDPQTGQIGSITGTTQMQALDSISCWSATACMIGGSKATHQDANGFPSLIRATAGVFGAPHAILSSGGVYKNGGAVNAIQCFSASTCSAVGWLYRSGVGGAFSAWN
jgi:hypothetical protein